MSADVVAEEVNAAAADVEVEEAMDAAPVAQREEPDENIDQISPIPRVIPPLPEDAFMNDAEAEDRPYSDSGSGPNTVDGDFQDPDTLSDVENVNSYDGDTPPNSKDGHGVDENFPCVIRAKPVQLASKTRLKVTINKLNVTAEWKWTAGGDDTCGICRMPFEACCVECKCPGDECPLVIGQCKHPFHMHCIVKWTDTQNTPKPQCPLCRQEWKFAS